MGRERERLSHREFTIFLRFTLKFFATKAIREDKSVTLTFPTFL